MHLMLRPRTRKAAETLVRNYFCASAFIFIRGALLRAKPESKAMWRKMAEKARKQAAEMQSAEAREIRLRVAEYYDRLAKKADNNTAGNTQPSS
jgi:hypothetical protein